MSTTQSAARPGAILFTRARLSEMGMPAPEKDYFLVTFRAGDSADDMVQSWIGTLDEVISAVRAIDPEKFFVRTGGPDVDVHASELMRRCLPADHPSMQPIATVLTRQHFVDDGACPIRMPAEHQFLVIIGSPVPSGSQPASISKVWAPSIQLAAEALQGIGGDQIEIRVGANEDPVAILAELRARLADARLPVH